jgi:osmotically-inducible protein OsmY
MENSDAPGMLTVTMLCFVIFSLSRPSRTAISLILLAILCSPAILDSARSEGTNAENSRTATRYSDQQYRTAMDQSNDPDDIKTTAEIRKLVVGDGSLSIRAKNVMIITIHGYVTLRGAVETQEERSTIERHAKQVGAKTIVNQLEIKGS